MPTPRYSRSDKMLTGDARRFVPGYAAAAQRLDEHAKKLVAKVILDGNVSLDTVQGFCALCPWLVSERDCSPLMLTPGDCEV